MRILIIEDDEVKLAALRDYLEDKILNLEVLVGQSLHSGQHLALGTPADLIFLDMTMMNFDRGKTDDGGRPHAFAGREILRRMRRNRIDTPVVIFTQFRRFDDDKNSMSLEELNAELARRFPNFLGTVEYQLNVERWKSHVDEFLTNVSQGSI